MASNTRIPKAELTGIYGAIVKRMSRKMLGDVAEPVEIAWHNRKVLNFSFGVGRKALERDVMEYAEAMSQTPPTVPTSCRPCCSASSPRPRGWSSPR